MCRWSSSRQLSISKVCCCSPTQLSEVLILKHGCHGIHICCNISCSGPLRTSCLRTSRVELLSQQGLQPCVPFRPALPCQCHVQVTNCRCIGHGPKASTTTPSAGPGRYAGCSPARSRMFVDSFRCFSENSWCCFLTATEGLAGFATHKLSQVIWPPMLCSWQNGPNRSRLVQHIAVCTCMTGLAGLV